MNFYVQLALWGLCGYGTGILLTFGAPVIASSFLEGEQRDKVAQQFFGWSMSVMKRALLVRRKHSGYDLVSTSFDSDYEAEELSLDGRTGHAEDVANLMTRAYTRPFGLLWEKKNTIVDPVVAEFGEYREEQLQTGEAEATIEVTGGQPMSDGGLVDAIAADVEVPTATRLVEPAKAAVAVTGSAPLWAAEIGYDITQKSQREFAGHNAAEYLMILAGFGLGFALVWFALSNGGGGGGSVVRMPMTLSPTLGVMG